jgi:predicted dehydrogenase
MLNIGVIALSMGKYHADAVYQSKKCRLSAICDINEELLKKCSDEYGPFVMPSTDWHNIINSPDIDAVCITTPDHFHLEMTVAALRAGKHVLCEKPLALHVDECKEMINVSKETGKILMVGQVCRVAPGFVKAKQIVDSGAIGDLYFVESEYAHDYTHLGGWRKDPANKRHPVTGGGCHAVDLLRWITGKEPTEVFSYATHVGLPDWPCDDTAIAVMKFNEALTGKVYVSTGCKRSYTMRTVIYGTKGTIICDNTTPYITLYLENYEGKDSFFGASLQTVGHQIPVALASHNVEAEINEFCDCIINGTQPLIPAEEGARTVALCEAIIRSSETGKPEKFIY